MPATSVSITKTSPPPPTFPSTSIRPRLSSKPTASQCRDQVAQVHPDAKLVEEKLVTLNKADASYSGYSALFGFQGKFASDTEQALLTKLLVFQYGDYFVTYRISYPDNDRLTTEKLINDFIQQLDWPPPVPVTTPLHRPRVC